MRIFLDAALEESDPIAMPWRELSESLQVEPGNLIFVIGTPGAYKSMFSLVWALFLAQNGEPVSLFSIDTTPKDQFVRMVSHFTGRDQREIRATRKEWREYLDLMDLPIRGHKDSVEIAEMGEIVTAHTEFFGRPPRLAVIDDLDQVVEEAEYVRMASAVKEFQREVARPLGIATVVLHHVPKGKDPTKPISAGDAMYVGAAKPEVVIGLWLPEPNILRIGILKNRNGPSHPNGDLYVDLEVDPARVQINDFKPQGQQVMA